VTREAQSDDNAENMDNDDVLKSANVTDTTADIVESDDK